MGTTNIFVLRAICVLVLALNASMVVQARPLRIETIAVEPLGFVGADGKPTGIMFEIGNRIAEEAGFAYTNTIVPYARTAVNLQSGAADFVMRYGNEQILESSIRVASIVKGTNIIVGPATAHYKTLADLHGKSVGVMRGGSFYDGFDADKAIKKVAVGDYLQMLKMLQAGRFDACLGSTAGIYYTAHKLGIKPDQLSAPWVLNSKDLELFYSKKTADEKTITALKLALEKLKESGEIRKIISKYMGDFDWEVE